MKERFTPNFQIHKDGDGGLTPHGLDPYANNGEKSMANAQNNEPTQQLPQNVDTFTQLPLGGQFESHTASNRSGYEQAPLEGHYMTFDEIYETAKAIAEANGENINDVPKERRTLLFEMAKNSIKPAPDWEYTPEDREYQPPPDIRDVPFSKEVQDKLDDRGFIDPAVATKRLTEYIESYPQMLSPALREVLQDQAARGIDVAKTLPRPDEEPRQESNGNLPRDAELAARPKSSRQERENTKIKDMNHLLEEIMLYSDNKWKRDGSLALVKKEIVDGIEREVVNQEHFMHWIQDRIVYYHGEDPDTAINMFTMVKLEREFKDITIVDMLNNQDLYFRDSHGNQYKDLADFVRLTLWQFSTYRTDAIEYNAGMGDDSGLNKIITKQFYNNSRSKPGFDNMSVLANVLTMANKYNSNPLTEEHRDKRTKPEKLKLDTDLGNAINTAFLAYFRISDPEKLRELLGEQAKYLLDPNEVRKQVLEVAQGKNLAVYDKNGEVDMEEARRFLESADGKAINSASFLFTGKDPSTPEEKSKMEKNLIQFINIFNLPTKNTDIENIVNGLVRKAIAEKFELASETGAATYAQLMAFFTARPMGAGARNDLAANANDALTKPMKLKPYRLKMAKGDRAGMVGNPYSVHMLKSVLVDYLNGSRTETLVEDEDGNVIKDNLGNPHYYSLMELMELMSAQGRDHDGVMKYAKKLRPTNISQRDWAQNHMNRGFEMFHDITESNEIDWSKFTEEDTWGNLRLNRGNFEKEFKDHFLKQMRYAYSTYGQLDFSKYVRDYDPDIENEDGTKGAWYDTPLVDTLFAKQVLNIKEFWKKDYLIDKKTGKFVMKKDKDGNDEKIVIKTYDNIIDPNEVQDQKKFLWKQLAIARIAADIRVHVDFFSTDPRYKPTYYLMMLEAIESIQDELIGDEHDFRRTKKKGHAFTHAQIQWLREAAGITDKRIFLQQAGEDLAKGIGTGLVDMMKGTLKSAFKIA